MDIFRNVDELVNALIRAKTIDQEAEELANEVALWVNDSWILDSRNNETQKENQ